MKPDSCQSLAITTNTPRFEKLNTALTLDNSKYTGYNIWHLKDWSVLLYQKTETVPLEPDESAGEASRLGAAVAVVGVLLEPLTLTSLPIITLNHSFL